MRKLCAAIVVSFAFGATTGTLACGPGTVKLIEYMVTTNEPPRYRCGSEFNEMLARAQKKDWKGALAAYEKHLVNLGKWEAGSANAAETLAYLRKKSAAR
jgi:hypothetical protein